MNIEKKLSNSSIQQEAAIVKPDKSRDLIQESIDGLNQWIVEGRRNDEYIPPIFFGDVNVSVQAGRHCHSNPKTDDAEKYTEVELGCPSEKPPDYIMEYADDPTNPTEAIYDYVPIELVAKWASEKGGLKALPAPEEEK